FVVVVRGIGGTLSAAALGRDRGGLVEDVGNGRSRHAHLDVGRDLDLDLAFVEHLGDGPDDAAARHHFVAAPQVRDHGLVLLHPLLLRTDEQEPKDHEYQYDGEQAGQHTIAAQTTTSGGL